MGGVGVSYCWNPGCVRPENSLGNERCEGCGDPLLLRDRYRAIRRLTRQPHHQSWQAIDHDAQAADSGDRVERLCLIAQVDVTDRGVSRGDAGRWKLQQYMTTQRLLGDGLGLPRLIEAWIESGKSGEERGYTVRRWIEGQTLAAELQHRSP